MILGAGLFGYLLELILFNKSSHVFWLYASMATFITVARKLFPDANIYLFTLIMAAIATMVECAVGVVGEMIRGKRSTWKYDSCECGGYVSLKTSCVWFVFIMVYVYAFDRLIAT